LPAGDVWALGVTICEALSLRKPAGLHAVGGSIALPADLPPLFRDMISKCLSRKPEDRPDVAKLQAWLKGGQLEPTPAQEQEVAAVTNVAPEATAPNPIRLVIRAELVSPDETAEPVDLKSHWRPLRLIVAAVVLLSLAAAGIYFLAADETPAVANVPVVAPPVGAEAPTPAAVTPQAPAAEVPATAAPATPVTPRDPSSVVNEVIPAVPRSASQTIRGTVRVSVRVIVGDDGKVVAATAADPGPSRYFERLSLEAAKQWTFVPAEGAEKRLMLVKFNYTRSGATAKASPVQ
jgi:TonB family protein